ncbi:MAG: hypothetical protein ABI193_16375 [Minicystis sp.]
MRSAALRAIFLGFATSAFALLVLDLQACSSGDDPRKGGLGESCTRTDDCATPLACIDKTCADGTQKPDGGSGGGGTGGSGTTSTTSTTGSGGQGPSADAGPWSDCDECLSTTCAAQLAACDEECIAIEACIETVCSHLSAIDAPAEEGACQTKCQSEHAGAKSKHLDVVNCAASASCLPPCVPYPEDDSACRSFMNKGDCKAARAACKDSSDCQIYLDCVSSCTTFKDCIACDDTPSGQAGRVILQDYQQCLAAECILTSWLPPL